ISRKQGFPSITDTGVMDLSLAGEGLSFQMGVATAQKKDAEHLFKVGKVDVDIKHLKIKLVESRYKMPFNLIQPVLMKVLNPVITKAVEKALKQQFQQWDRAAWEIKQDADKTLIESRAATDGKRPHMYSRYFDSMKKYMSEQKEEQKKKAASKTADKKINIAYTLQDSIFPNIKLPGATSEKATKYKDLAAQGDDWQSPVFSLGKASQSSDIPRAPKIEDKLDEKKTWGETRKRSAAEKGAEVKGAAKNKLDGGVQNAGSKLVGNGNRDGLKQSVDGAKAMGNGGQQTTPLVT
ncbi:DUF4449 domain-containing protein, partial [Candidatus Bathyarchaeota archaeon]|nr:DUF4449 domain-containing protein [Candidatus Bathyarchaeota archaeon]